MVDLELNLITLLPELCISLKAPLRHALTGWTTVWFGPGLDCLQQHAYTPACFQENREALMARCDTEHWRLTSLQGLLTFLNKVFSL